MDKAFSMGSMFGKFQYLMSWFKVALVLKQISMVMKKKFQCIFLRNYCHLFWLKFVCYCLVVSRDILLRILSCFLFWIVSGQTLEWKKHSKFKILLIFSVNKQTKHFFSYFNYYQLRMVFFFSIIKKQKKYLIIDQCWLFNSH